MPSTKAEIAHRLFLQPRPPSPLRLRIPPHDLPAAEAFAHFLEWDTVTCYATASLDAMWLLDLARTKTASVNGWVRVVVGKIVIGVVAGPGAMLRTIWGEREDTLVHAWKAEGETRTRVDSVVGQLQKGWEMKWLKRPVLFLGGNETPRLARISVACTCALA